jgi:hypothetical protein
MNRADSTKRKYRLRLQKISKKEKEVIKSKFLRFESASPIANLIIQVIAEILLSLTVMQVISVEFTGSNIDATTLDNLISVANSNDGNSSINPTRLLDAVVNSPSTSAAIGVSLVLLIILIGGSLVNYFRAVNSYQ